MQVNPEARTIAAMALYKTIEKLEEQTLGFISDPRKRAVLEARAAVEEFESFPEFARAALEIELESRLDGLWYRRLARWFVNLFK